MKRRSSVTSLLLTALLLAAACARDREMIYEKDEVTPREQALAFYSRDVECTECMEAKCDEVVRDCVDDADCAEEVTCRYPCDDPPCRQACSSLYPLGKRPSSSLEECGRKQCLEACGVGRNTSCVGNYGWGTPASEEPVEWHFRLLGRSGDPLGEGFHVRVCEAVDSTCKDPAYETLSDDRGEATVKFPVHVFGGEDLQPFRGYIEFEDSMDPPRAFPTRVIPSQPPSASFPRPFKFEPVFLNADDVELVSTLLDVAIEPGAAQVYGVVMDCNSLNEARLEGATVAIDAADDNTRYFYGALYQDEATDLSGFFSVANVPPGLTKITVTHDDMFFSDLNIPLRADWSHLLWLLPEAVE